jgi:hypothetical protein
MTQQQKGARQPSNGQRQERAVQLSKMRWFFLIILVVWTLAAITVPVVVFFLTRSPLSFSLFSTLAPPFYLWLRFTKHLFPMDKKTYKLKKMRIQRGKRNDTHSPDTS